MTTRFAGTVVYVRDPAASVDFYRRAFGFSRRHFDEHENGAYAELDTGEVLLAFASHELVGRHLPGEWAANDPSSNPAGFELYLLVDDVAAAYLTAIGAGATAVAPPAPKERGQTVGYVRDADGVLVEIASAPR